MDPSSSLYILRMKLFKAFMNRFFIQFRPTEETPGSGSINLLAAEWTFLRPHLSSPENIVNPMRN
jgi:hypothetical protein